MSLQVLVPDQIWFATHLVRFGPLQITTRATFVKLLDGSIWVHSPIPASEEIIRSLAQIGPVRYVIAPNRSHHLYFLQFLEAFPDAHGFIALGLKEKRTSLAGFQVLDELAEVPWQRDFESALIRGLPVLNETAWLHLATGTLILTDLLFCFGTTNGIINRTVARLLGVYNKLAMSRTMKVMVKDKDAFTASISRIMSWDIRRVIVAHDQIIESETMPRLRDAFAWLRD